MAKCVLVMDMPESCDKCTLFGGFYSDMICRANGRSINYPYPDKSRQNWCPLRPLPEKMEARPYQDYHRHGWNDCIDEITGGEQHE